MGGFGTVVGIGISSSRLTGKDPPEKVTFLRVPAEGDRGNLVNVWGRAFWAEGTGSAKALGWA